MENRLTQAQLAQVVAEVERLSQIREAELEPEKVKEILQELNLPSDLLEDALVQLRRREALAQQQKRNWLIVAGVVLVLIGVIATTTFFKQRHQQAIAQVSAIESRITLAQDNGSSVDEFYLVSNLEVYYRVTLKDAPLGSRLSLSCDWVDPNGQVVHQSRYQTRQIDRPVWTTYCYHQLSPSVAKGTWEVRMFLEGRSLSTQKFVVQ
jgi:hypothetical protein